MVVIGPIPVIFKVRLIVFPVIRDKVVERETVVAGDEVDAVIGRPSVISVEVGRSCESPSEIPYLPSIPLAKFPDGISKSAIPFGPSKGKFPT